MSSIQRISLLCAVFASSVPVSVFSSELLLISRFPPMVGTQLGPDAPLIQSLELAGFQVNTFFMGQLVRHPRFDAALLDAVNQADAIVISPFDPTFDILALCLSNKPQSAKFRFTDVARPTVAITASTPLEQVPELVADAISSAPHPPIAYAVSPVGDFDGDGVYGIADFSLMFDALRSATPDARFDVSGSGTVDYQDLDLLVVDIYSTWWGDANLDGSFSTGDLVTVFQAGKYETGMPADWGEGDWNGDLLFNSSDLVHVLSKGHCSGPRTAVAVPEPMSVGNLIMSIAVMCSALRSRRTCLADKD